MIKLRQIAAALIAAAFIPAIFFLIYHPREKGFRGMGKPPREFFSPIEDTQGPFRPRYWLDGEWNFRPSGARKWTKVLVPHVWNAIPGMESYEGRATYKKVFSLPAVWNNRRVMLRFEGIAGEADVTVNGSPLGHLAGRGVQREMDITDAVDFGGKNLLEITVSNAAPQAWRPEGRALKNHGGIFREVYLESIPATRFRSLVFRTTSLSASRAIVAARFEIESDTAGTSDVYGEIRGPDGERIAGMQDRIDLDPARPQAFTWKVTVKEPKLWWTAQPELYSGRILILTPDLQTDGMGVRFGIRTFGASRGAFKLNGQEIYLRGIDRVEDFGPGWGPVQTAKGIEFDIQKARDAGFNAVRTVYGPPHPAFVRQCDEAGLLVLEELPVYGLDGGSAHDGTVRRQATEMLESMIHRDENNPSVAMWGLGMNIDPGDAAARRFAESLAARARQLDPARPVYFVPKAGAVGIAAGGPASANLADAQAEGKGGGAFAAGLDKAIAAAGAARPALAFGVQSPGVEGYLSGAGRIGTLQDQLADLAAKRHIIDTRPALDGEFIHGLSDYALPAFMTGQGRLSPTGLMSIFRKAKPAYQWLSDYDPAKPIEGLEAKRAALPASPPAAELLALCLMTIFAFGVWSGQGRVAALMLRPQDAAPVRQVMAVLKDGKKTLIEVDEPGADWPITLLGMGLPAFALAVVSGAAALSAFASRGGWGIMQPDWGGPWPGLFAASFAARLLFAAGVQAAALLLTSILTGLLFRTNVFVCAELLSRCIVPRTLLFLAPLLPLHPAVLAAVIAVWEISLRGRALKETLAPDPLRAWLAAIAAPAVSIAAVAAILRFLMF